MINMYYNLKNKWLNKQLTKKYRGQRIPLYSEKYDCWVVYTDNGIEYGDFAYIAAEFCRTGLMYHYSSLGCQTLKQPNHEHTFEGILRVLLDCPESFTIEEFYDEYSLQEIEYLKAFQKRLIDVKLLQIN